VTATPAASGERAGATPTGSCQDGRRPPTRDPQEATAIMDAISSVPEPANEPVRAYPPGSAERESLRRRIAELKVERHELPMTIGGVPRMAGGDAFRVVCPHDHEHVLGVSAQATDADVVDAVAAAQQAAPGWRELPFDERAAILLRAADLLSGPWRDTLNAATMLGQSKSVQQAEIDAACELIDFWRFNVHFAREVLAEQPRSAAGEWNRIDHRPLDGFVTAITPFNFTAIAGNLPTGPALMGNTVVWKPTPSQQLAAHYTMRLLAAAGLPPGVINLVTGDGAAVSEVALADRNFAGLHFTGSTRTFKYLWRRIAENLDHYRSYPRIVGETGGKDFVLAHPSADPAALVAGLVRGAFEYQGQKCSAASRAYLPRSLWEGGLRERLADTAAAISYGDVADFRHFGGAVIDARAFTKHSELFERVRNERLVEILVGGVADDRVGYFVQPTVLVGEDPYHEVFNTEYFGPILSVFVYPDADWPKVLELVDGGSAYALTGSVFATDRAAVDEAHAALRFAAGNFYVNDKPTGAVVGRQPFGGSRASGTNDKAGSAVNLRRWVSPRAIKETFVPPTRFEYPHMA
jgi:1-pyrroline-5-carboxylate dehydrogenase